MINTEDFVKRLEILFDYYGLNASSFADKIGVQRSSLSHLLSGRNKPSLDLILKIIAVFPEVDLYWILNGKGNFPMIENNEQPITPPSPIIASSILDKSPKMEEELFEEQQLDIFSEKNIEEKKLVIEEKHEIPKKEIISELNTNSEIERIVIFYKNKTFSTYSPE